MEWDIVPYFVGGILKTALKRSGYLMRKGKMNKTPRRGSHYYVSLAETTKAIFRLSKWKAPGPDGIPIVVIKQLA
ncbi:hypothetical protein EVAR_99500_1 [Eumeta japonica]|uniref:Uncharacterized protein n=1 Tax=Eumeta variegata TaxID=151549 RepID=A0A4C1Z420_EUMVA|nr:hypothetical protein EVAR_99500_1 [Eumeta japonica]